MCRIAEDHFELMMNDYQKGTPPDRLMDCNAYLQELQNDVILDRSDVEFFSTIHKLVTYKFKLLILDDRKNIKWSHQTHETGAER